MAYNSDLKHFFHLLSRKLPAKFVYSDRFWHRLKLPKSGEMSGSFMFFSFKLKHSDNLCSNGLLYGYYCALCCSDWPSTTHQETIRMHLTSHGHKLAYFRRQYFAAYRDITQWPLYGAGWWIVVCCVLTRFFFRGTPRLWSGRVFRRWSSEKEQLRVRSIQKH